MLDIKKIAERPDAYRKMLLERFCEIDTEKLTATHLTIRELKTETEKLQHQRNSISNLIGKGKLPADEKKTNIEKVKHINAGIKDNEQKISELEENLNAELSIIPNTAYNEVPYGSDEEDNVEIKRWGTPRDFDFEPKHHADFGSDLNVFNFDRGTKISGTRFTLLRKNGAMLERAIANFMLDLHIKEHGYEEVQPPLMVNRSSLYGTGQLPKFEEDVFQTTTGHFLIPTAEVPLTNIFAGEIGRASCRERVYAPV